MSRQAIWAVALVAGAAAIAALMIMLRPAPAEQEVASGAPLVSIASYEVAEGAIPLYGSGTVQPREEVTLGAEVAGRLVHVNPNFREGSAVGRGAVLFRIDPADYTNRVRSAQADVAAQEVAVLQAREEVAIASAELDRFAARQNTLGGSRGALSRSIDANDYASRILPPEGLSGARAPAAAAPEPNGLATREPQLRSAEAARDRAAAQLADARLALSRTEVRAPFAGLVRSESAAVGTLVQPGQSLGSIVASDSFEVRISLTEQEAVLLPALFAQGGNRIPARVELDYGDATYAWDAYVDRIDPILDEQTRTINVFLRVPSPMRSGTPVLAEGEEPTGELSSPPLLLGSFVRAIITGAAEQPYAAIPAEALRTGNEVWLLRQGKLHIVPVHVIQRTDTIAYVAAPDLGEGGQVITSSLRTPVEGMALRAESEGAASE